jgi:hypothetical protein
VFALNPEGIPGMEEPYSKQMRHMATNCLAEVEDAAAAAGINCEVINVTDEHPYHDWSGTW